MRAPIHNSQLLILPSLSRSLLSQCIHTHFHLQLIKIIKTALSYLSVSASLINHKVFCSRQGQREGEGDPLERRPLIMTPEWILMVYWRLRKLQFNCLTNAARLDRVDLSCVEFAMSLAL